MPTATSWPSTGSASTRSPPGYFKTAITENLRADPDNERRVVEHVPAGRWGDPADLMGPLVFLACAASDYVNGQVLVVDGGYLVR